MNGRHSGVSRDDFIKAIISLMVLLAIFAAIFLITKSTDENVKEESVRGTNEERLGFDQVVEYNGKQYAKKTNVDLILLMGIDTDNQSAGRYGSRSGGQADFLSLLVVDNENKTLRILHLDRDTMTEITTLSVFGDRESKMVAQLSLSHGFGDGMHQSCKYTVKAVEDMLGDTEIDKYVSLDYNAFRTINDLLGGVTVIIPEDMTNEDPAFVKGAEVKLTGEQAEKFVRARGGVGNQTNAERMTRQKIYMDAATQAFRKKIESDSNFLNTFCAWLDDNTVTNMSVDEMLVEILNASEYSTYPIDSFEGTHKKSDQGFTEFYINDGAVMDWKIRALYSKKSR